MKNAPIRILLLEDVAVDAEVLAFELDKLDVPFQCSRVETEDAFVRALDEFRPDIVLSDYYLPRFDALSAIKLLKKHAPDIPLIVVTGSINEETAVECMKAGACDYLLKGRLMRLTSAIKSALEKKQISKSKRRADQALKRLEKAIETIQLGVTITDLEGNILYTNPAEAEMHGYSVADLIGKDVRILAPPESRNPVSAEAIRDMVSWRRESLNVRKDGVSFPVQLISEVVIDDDGELIGIITTCEDITERKRAEEHLVHKALYDSLTDLPNRYLFRDRLAHCMRKARRPGVYEFAVLYMDVDEFKPVNDQFGHFVGDQLLANLARRLEECVRPGDTVARIGGDEFAILMDNVPGVQEAEGVATRILENLKRPFLIEGHQIVTGMSIGIALSDEHHATAEELLRDADQALYHAKEHGKSRYEFFDETLHKHGTGLAQDNHSGVIDG